MGTPRGAEKHLGQILLEKGLISQEQLDEALRLQNITRDWIGHVLADLHFVQQRDVLRAWAEQLGIPFLELDRVSIDREVAKTIPERLTQRHGAVPVRLDGNRLTVAMVDPSDLFALDALRLATGYRIDPMLAAPDDISALLRGDAVPSAEHAAAAVRRSEPVLSFPFRLVSGSLREWRLEDFAHRVRHAPVGRLSFTQGAIAIVTSLAGGRMARWKLDLLQDLSEILSGALPGGNDEYDDAHMGLYGEIVGPFAALADLSVGGDWEIIRILGGPQSRGKRPDFLLRERGRGAKIVLECKTVGTDAEQMLHDSRERDVCALAHRRMHDGMEQVLTWEPPVAARNHPARLTVGRDGPAVPLGFSERVVATTVVADGRLVPRIAQELGSSPEHSSRHAWLVKEASGVLTTVLGWEPAISPARTALPGGGGDDTDRPRDGVLLSYKACERALWQRGGGAFSIAFDSLLKAASQVPGEDLEQSVDFLAGPLEMAVASHTPVDSAAIRAGAEKYGLPARVRRALEDLLGGRPSVEWQQVSVVDGGRAVGSQIRRSSLATGQQEEWPFQVGEEVVYVTATVLRDATVLRLTLPQPLHSPAEGTRDVLDAIPSVLAGYLDLESAEQSLAWEAWEERVIVKPEMDLPEEVVGGFTIGWQLIPGPFLRPALAGALRGRARRREQRAVAEGPQHRGEEPFRPLVEPWRTFSAWVSYDGRGEVWLP